MVLDDKLKEVTLEDIKQIDILNLDSYARINEEALNILYNKGIIDDSSIEGALEVAVFNQARQDYDMMTAKDRAYIIYADHIGRPGCLAYALNKDKFSEKEIKKIPFDHGYNADTFQKHYGEENLLSVLREELLNPKPASNN